MLRRSEVFYGIHCVYNIMFPSTSQALGGVVAMDVLGLIRGWKFFDHAGHLGGVLFAV